MCMDIYRFSNYTLGVAGREYKDEADRGCAAISV